MTTNLSGVSSGSSNRLSDEFSTFVAAETVGLVLVLESLSQYSEMVSVEVGYMWVTKTH